MLYYLTTGSLEVSPSVRRFPLQMPPFWSWIPGHLACPTFAATHVSH